MKIGEWCYEKKESIHRNHSINNRIKFRIRCLSSNLNINGTSHINNATWNIYWDNVQVTTGSVTASTPNISNGTTVSYNVTLTNPGDYYEFTVDAVNAGSINAIIDSITTTLNDGPMTSLPSYLNYSLTNENGEEIAVGQELNSGETKKYKFRIDYKNLYLRQPINSRNFIDNSSYIQETTGIIPIEFPKFPSPFSPVFLVLRESDSLSIPFPLIFLS